MKFEPEHALVMNAETQRLHQRLVETIRFLHSQGWAPATSSNYSVRLPHASDFWVSASGIDKGEFQTRDLILVDAQGESTVDTRKPSAETLIHSLIYELYPDVHCILHTHTIHNTVLSRAHYYDGSLNLENFELLKGIQGISTHDTSVVVPIFPNSQDMVEFTNWVRARHENNPEMKGFLIAGHGFYTWGRDIAETKRHVEVFEFLFEAVFKLKLYTR